jgi:magnesium chelatase family protein
MKTIAHQKGVDWLVGQVEQGVRSVLMVGTPSSGRTFLARRLAEAAPVPIGRMLSEVCWLYAGNGMLPPVRPFRAPHHTISEPALLGGGRPARPGEVSLAHGGTLYLDDAPEFRGRVLQELWRTLAKGHAALRGCCAYDAPARPALVLASACPCPCGYHGSPSRVCRCSEAARRRYRRTRIAPLAGHFELTVRVRLSGIEAGRTVQPLLRSHG